MQLTLLGANRRLQVFAQPDTNFAPLSRNLDFPIASDQGTEPPMPGNGVQFQDQEALDFYLLAACQRFGPDLDQGLKQALYP